MQRGFAIVTAVVLVALFAALLQPAAGRARSKPAPRRLAFEAGWYDLLEDRKVVAEIRLEQRRSTVRVECQEDGLHDLLQPPQFGGRRWDQLSDLTLAELRVRLGAVPDKAQCWVQTELADWGDSDRVRGLTDFLRRTGWRVVVFEAPSGSGYRIIAVHYFNE